jgi:hypothetical protein
MTSIRNRSHSDNDGYFVAGDKRVADHPRSTEVVRARGSDRPPIFEAQSFTDSRSVDHFIHKATEQNQLTTSIQNLGDVKSIKPSISRSIERVFNKKPPQDPLISRASTGDRFSYMLTAPPPPYQNLIPRAYLVCASTVALMRVCQSVFTSQVS